MRRKDNIQQSVQDLERKLITLREDGDRHSVEAEKWQAKRNKLNGQVRKLQIKIDEQKGERDKLNKQVGELKQLREKTLDNIRKKAEEMTEIDKQCNTLSKKLSRESLTSLQRKLHKIEWEIQTTPLNLEEEKEAVNEARELEAQIELHQRLETLEQKLFELQAESKASKTQNKIYHEKLTEKAQRSQEIHEKMLETIKRAKELRAEADETHRKFLKAKKKERHVYDEANRVLDQIALLTKEMRDEDEQKRREKEEALREEIVEKAREKLKRGGKLTWEEFQILTRSEKTTQD